MRSQGNPQRESEPFGFSATRFSIRGGEAKILGSIGPSYSERDTQGCIAIHRGSENVIDPYRKDLKGNNIIYYLEISEGLATLRPNLVTGTRLY